MTFTISKERLALLASKYKKPSLPEPIIQTIPSTPTQEDAATTTDRYGNQITYNSRQQEFISLASSGASCVLVGAAGTGKTTCQKGATEALIQSGRVGILPAVSHKYLVAGTPGIVICAYTRRAAANIAANLSPELRRNCMTIHALLQYEPVWDEVLDQATGITKKTMRFEAQRNALNPLPPEIKTIIFEETSMLGTDLHQEVIDACPHNPQFIYLGDIQQLYPVFGPAILGFKFLELPVIELTEVYRQALESPIISLAHRVISGKGLPAMQFPSWNKPGLTIRPFKKKVDPEQALIGIGQLICNLIASGHHDPAEDMILIPFNKSFGTVELNKIIANYLARKSGAFTYEIVAGFQKIYLSSGDKILVDKEDAIITKIETNPSYVGARYRPASQTLDYWGHDSSAQKTQEETDDASIDFMLEQVASASREKEDRVNQASHIIHFRKTSSEITEKLTTAGELNELLLGYALTVHKAQGSEWNKVIFIMHHSHAVMNSRELLYTAITRAKKELLILCEPDSLMKGIENPRIKGNTIAEKAIYFQGKKAIMDSERLT